MRIFFQRNIDLDLPLKSSIVEQAVSQKCNLQPSVSMKGLATYLMYALSSF